MLVFVTAGGYCTIFGGLVEIIPLLILLQSIRNGRPRAQEDVLIVSCNKRKVLM